MKENENIEIADKTKKERKKSESNEAVSCDKEIHTTLSPKAPPSDPPEPEELIKALQDLENAASSDGTVREKIAQLPADVSDVALISNILGKYSWDIFFMVKYVKWNCINRPKPSQHVWSPSEWSSRAHYKLQRKTPARNGKQKAINKNAPWLYSISKRTFSPSWDKVTGSQSNLKPFYLHTRI